MSSSTEEWDPRKQYKAVLEAVEAASDKGAVKVFKLQHGTTRVEYYVVGCDTKDRRIVGMKALAIYS